jgi:hypothetical protein
LLKGGFRLAGSNFGRGTGNFTSMGAFLGRFHGRVTRWMVFFCRRNRRKTRRFAKKASFAAHLQIFFDEKMGLLIDFILTERHFSFKKSKQTTLNWGNHPKCRKFTETGICYFKNCCYVCNEIINDSFLPRSFFISSKNPVSFEQPHQDRQITSCRFGNNSNHKKK